MKIITDIKGGLGNQMFCYAFGYAVAKECGAEYWIDSSMLDQQKVKGREFELSNFRICYDKHISYHYDNTFFSRKLGINRLRKRAAIGFNTKIYKEKANYIYEEDVFRLGADTYFDGFWQSHRYFDAYRSDLCKQLVPAVELEASVKEIEKEIRTANSVSMHIRRGDYLSLNWQLPMSYYGAALKTIQEKIGKGVMLKVYIFSDDPEYVRDYFGTNAGEGMEYRYVEYASKNRTINDMYLMSACRHNIIANSSYSWWAAYRNQYPDRIVICPEIDVWSGDFYPEGWVRLEV